MGGWDLRATEEDLLGGRWAEVERRCRRELGIHPSNGYALHLHALALSAAGSQELAIKLLKRALEIRPGEAGWWAHLGVVHFAAERWGDAVSAFRRSLAIAPLKPPNLVHYARALVRTEKYREALGLYREALKQRPTSADLLRYYGEALVARGKFQAAADVLDRSAALEPDAALTHQLALRACFGMQRLERALYHARELRRVRSDRPSTLLELARTRWEVGQLDESLADFREALAHRPDPRGHSAYLFALLHDCRQTPTTLLEEHRAWAVRYASEPANPLWYPNSPEPERRLRIGYISGEFRGGASFFHIFPLLKNHRAQTVETICYHTYAGSDAGTTLCQQHCDRWRDVSVWPDERIAASVREDAIDILVDLSGHLPGNRLGVLTRRPAPIQVSFPVYPSTTGLPQIDYIFTSNWVTPPRSECHYAERVYRLPSGCLAYRPPDPLPNLKESPSMRTGQVTFGLFQRAGKLGRAVWDVVATIFKRLPRAGLLVHYGSADLDDTASASRRWILRELQTRGVSQLRVEFAGYRPRRKHLELLSRADIALDTFPYNGQTTTFDCLWMGIPVVTAAGAVHASRVGMEILSRVGLGEWVGQSPEDYVEIAVAAGRQPERLRNLRQELRERIAASDCSDGRNLTPEVEDAYRWMWRQYCIRHTAIPQQDKSRFASGSR